MTAISSGTSRARPAAAPAPLGPLPRAVASSFSSCPRRLGLVQIYAGRQTRKKPIRQAMDTSAAITSTSQGPW
ncbi:hypothetical protein GCM10009416_14020 [Craurococcus roseus]|uniref:Uncharacterized protein n=1 Tax=Craurococcus roseus TaxID=77585 RepID=A0ABN1EWX5_9PROT